MATSITKDGITWNFSADRPTGTYMNGDPWVQEPVTVISISPAPATVGGRAVNGTMQNFAAPWSASPGNYEQGFDGFPPAHSVYNSALNAGLLLPLALSAGDSLISVDSNLAAAGPWFSTTNRVALLTVVAAPPASNEFRPSYTYPVPHPQTYYWDDGMLARLPRDFPASWGANIATQANRLKSLWFNAGSGEGNWRFMGTQHSPDYYTARNTELGEMFMALCSDIPAVNKRGLAQAMIQYGLDIIGAVRNGYYGGSTHSQGKKAPAVFASLMLGLDALKPNALCREDLTTDVEGRSITHRAVWGEDGQTFVVEETSPGVINFGQGGYTAAHLGLVDWGNFHYLEDGHNDLADWTSYPPGNTNTNNYRQCCAASTWASMYLSMMAMGAQELWDWDPFFDWTYRWITTAPTLGLSLQGCPASVLSVFNAYKPQVGTGFRQVGLSKPGSPRMTVVGTPNASTPYVLRIETGGVPTIGILIRCSSAAVRPKPDWYGAPTVGHVYLDETGYEVHGFFGTDGAGTALISMPAIDAAGVEYAVQAGLLLNGQFVVTPAFKITIQ